MSRRKLSFPLLLITSVTLLMFSEYGFAGNPQKLKRFDFQEKSGEGQFDLYRAEVDLAGGTGRFCVLSTYMDGVPDSYLGDLHEKSFGQVLDMDKYKPACFDFFLYSWAGDPGWFFSPPIKREAVYRYFFVGEIGEERMEGKLYEFRDYQVDDDRIDRTVHWIMVDAPVALVSKTMSGK